MQPLEVTIRMTRVFNYKKITSGGEDAVKDRNEKREFPCGCIVEWHLDKIKFTDCKAHSGKGLEMRVLGNVTLTA